MAVKIGVGYAFSSVFVMNRVLILAILVLNKGRVWCFSLALGVSLLTQTVSSHKYGSECLVRSQFR